MTAWADKYRGLGQCTSETGRWVVENSKQQWTFRALNVDREARQLARCAVRKTPFFTYLDADIFDRMKITLTFVIWPWLYHTLWDIWKLFDCIMRHDHLIICKSSCWKIPAVSEKNVTKFSGLRFLLHLDSVVYTGNMLRIHWNCRVLLTVGNKKLQQLFYELLGGHFIILRVNTHVAVEEISYARAPGLKHIYEAIVDVNIQRTDAIYEYSHVLFLSTRVCGKWFNTLNLCNMAELKENKIRFVTVMRGSLK